MYGDLASERERGREGERERAREGETESKRERERERERERKRTGSRPAAGHVLEAVVAAALDHRHGPRVPHLLHK